MAIHITCKYRICRHWCVGERTNSEVGAFLNAPTGAFPNARAVPKNKVVPEDGETIKAAMNGKLRNGGLNGGSHRELMAPNPRKRGRPPTAATEAAGAERLEGSKALSRCW